MKGENNMKKILAILLAVLLLAAMTACSADQTANEDTTAAAADTTVAVAETTAETTEAPVQTEEDTDDDAVGDAYSYTYEGVEIIPGTVFDASVLPEAEFVYEIPSCAFDGTDTVYSYGVLEIITYADGSDQVIYSICLLDANTPTPEGLYIGDDASLVLDLYGTDCQQEENQIVYQKGETLLVFILENDVVQSIEYRLDA